MIDVAGLTVRFAGFDAVRDVSFSIGAGESYGLVGESGSGKSTILRVLAGLNAQWSGAVTIDGRPLVPPARLRGPARRDFFRRVQMVFQDPYGSLHPRQTIDRILAEPLLVHGLDGIDARIVRALDEVALPASLRFRFPHQLSGGQRQRVAIARALIAGPEVLLLDEPTSALDVSMQAGVLNLLADLRAARRLTCVLVTHNLAVVAHLCERIAVMQGGAMVEEVGVAALRAGEVRHPHTEELWRLTMALEEVG